MDDEIVKVFDIIGLVRQKEGAFFHAILPLEGLEQLEGRFLLGNVIGQGGRA